VRGLRWVEEPKLQGLGCIFSSNRNKCVQDAFQSGRGSRPDAGKRFSMNRQLADETPHRIRTEIGIGESGIAADWNWRIVGWRNTQAGLREPVSDDCFEMLSTADAFHVRLRCERSVPGENLETIEPAVLNHQKPSFVTKGVEAANGAGGALSGCVVHTGSLGQLAHAAGRGVGKEAGRRALVNRNGHHSDSSVETECEVRGAGIA
jgi:hypothetical protein